MQRQDQATRAYYAQENVSKYLASDDKSNRRGFGTVGYMKHEEIRGNQTRIKKNFNKYFTKRYKRGPATPKCRSHSFAGTDYLLYAWPGSSLTNIVDKVFL